MKPFFSIIIPSLNEEKNLPVLLNSIKNQTNKDFEVIVVDSLSTDNTKNRALEFSKTIPNFRFISHKSKNVSIARNYGVSLAKGEFLIFFDADVEMETKFIEEIKNKINKYNLEMTTVWNRPKTKNLSGKLALTFLNLAMSLFQKVKPGANGPCIIIQKKVFEKIRGFDEEVIFGEDFDLTQRACKVGARFKVLSYPILYVSTRRFEKEGFFISVSKFLKAIFHQLVLGPIRKPIFKYEMGGQYYRNIKNQISKIRKTKA